MNLSAPEFVLLGIVNATAYVALAYTPSALAWPHSPVFAGFAAGAAALCALGALEVGVVQP